MNKAHQNLRKRIRETVHSIIPDAEVYLYGSRSRGDANKYSDWDILILFDDKYTETKLPTNLADALYEIEFETGQIISPAIYPIQLWHAKYPLTDFYKNVMEDGVLL